MRAEPSAEDRFTDLYERYYWQLLRYAVRRLHDRHLAREVVQDVFTVAWRRLEDVPDPALPWLYGTARNTLLGYVTRQQRQDQLQVRLISEARTATTADGPDEDGWVSRALEQLSERDQEVLRLAAWEQLSGAEIAQVLNCSSSAAAVRLHRARQRLRRVLSQPSDTADDHPEARHG